MRYLISLSGPLMVLVACLALCGCGGGGNNGNQVILDFRNPYLAANYRALAPASAPTNIAWMAFQDGDNPWQAVAIQPSGVYTLPVSDPDGRYGVAVGYCDPNAPEHKYANVLYATLDEIRDASQDSFAQYSNESSLVNFNIMGLGATEYLTAAIQRYGFGTQYSPISFVDCPLTGTYDIDAALWDHSEYMAKRLLRVPSVPIQNGATIDLDFSGAGAYDMGSAYTVTASNALVDFGYSQICFENRNRLATAYSINSPLQYRTIPTELHAAGDRYMHIVCVDDLRSAQLITPTPDDYTVQFRPLNSAQTLSSVTVDGHDYMVISGGFDDPEMIVNCMHLWWEYSTNREGYTEGTNLELWYTPGWMNGDTSFTMPDFSSTIPNWPMDWGATIDLSLYDLHTFTCIGNMPTQDAYLSAFLLNPDYSHIDTPMWFQSIPGLNVNTLPPKAMPSLDAQSPTPFPAFMKPLFTPPAQRGISGR